MQIAGSSQNISVQGAQAAQANANTARQMAGTPQTGADFSKKVMTCVSASGQKVMLRSDALMSYASPQTGESVNIYRAEAYTKDNPVYVVKGLDAAGKEFSYEVDAAKIDPNRCSFNELMVLNVETGGNTPQNYLQAVIMRDKSGTSSYFETADYLSAGKAALSDFRTLGAWDSYLSMDQWLTRILAYAAHKAGARF